MTASEGGGGHPPHGEAAAPSSDPADEQIEGVSARANADAKDAAVVAGRGALFIGFAKVFFMVSSFLQGVLLTRFMGGAHYGVFSVVNGAVSAVNNAVVQATIQAVSKFTAEDDARADAVKRAGLRMQAVLGTLIGLAFFLGAPLLAEFYKDPGYTRWFRLVALIPFFYAFYAVFVGSANGLRRFRTQAGFDVTFSSLKTVLLVVLGAIFGVGGALAGFVLAAAAILVIAARAMRMPSAQSGSFPPRRLAVFMGEVISYGLLLNLALQYDLLLLRRFAAHAVADAALADSLAGHYGALRNVALLPYSALIVVTFVIFPLVSRSTFAQDRAATRSYVTQTLRYALILAAAMGVALGARPATLLAILYKPEYGEGATALPVLVAGECCLALLGVTCSILNAAGRAKAAVTLVALTVAVGAVAAWVLVPAATPGAPMLLASATATSIGMATGFLASVVYLGTRLGGGPPLPSVVRIATAAAAAVLVGRFMPVGGKVLGLATIAVVGLVYLGVLVALREFDADDRAKFVRILRRR